jgi:hypothetical protein
MAGLTYPYIGFSRRKPGTIQQNLDLHDDRVTRSARASSAMKLAA